MNLSSFVWSPSREDSLFVHGPVVVTTIFDLISNSRPVRLSIALTPAIPEPCFKKSVASLYFFVPEMILFHSISLGLVLQNSYLYIDNFIPFFILLVIIQISITIVEETIYRGFINKRGSEHFNQISAVFISAYSYAFLSLLYYLRPINVNFFNWFPLIWVFTSFFIGIILSLLTLRKKWLFPPIFAHSLSNIVILSMIWFYLNGWKYLELMLFIYTPLLCFSFLLLVIQYKRIRDSITVGIKMLRKYLKNDEEIDETNTNKYFQILFDIIIGFLVFLIGFLIII